ncbi:uncharacterized protein LOC133789785 [Humulus lupulus]|uniref:uncharacterized protein LOC133789785 n=1 Tax=Humulus lupulus TaxID=3486 RepID=UPI002B408A93|nr:uncharacterized protein LOC133789785 [Humulus lupulus]
MAASGSITRSVGRLYKWPAESVDGESMTLLVGRPKAKATRIRALEQPKVVDSVSCRQMFLRSYTFSRKESFSEKTNKCLGRVLVLFHRKGRDFQGIRRLRRMANKKVPPKRHQQMAAKNIREKEASCAALLLSKVRRLVLCYAPPRSCIID